MKVAYWPSEAPRAWRRRTARYRGHPYAFNCHLRPEVATSSLGSTSSPRREFDVGEIPAGLFVGALLFAFPAAADPFFFSTGSPDGKIATLCAYREHG